MLQKITTLASSHYFQVGHQPPSFKTPLRRVLKKQPRSFDDRGKVTTLEAMLTLVRLNPDTRNNLDSPRTRLHFLLRFAKNRLYQPGELQRFSNRPEHINDGCRLPSRLPGANRFRRFIPDVASTYVFTPQSLMSFIAFRAIANAFSLSCGLLV